MSNRPRKQPASLRSSVASRAKEAALQAERERTRRTRMWGWIGGTIAVVVVVGAVTAFLLTRSDPVRVTPSEEAVALGCASCHSVDGARSEGPTWKGLYGSTVTLADGSTVTVDEDYLRESILAPGAQVAPGYPTAMPTVEVTDAQLEALVAFIRSLGA